MNPENHFNIIAKDYDYWKNKNWYYYRNLKTLYGSFIPANSRIWEIGCGTGDILASLEPSTGLGTDISEEMINMAKQKYSGKINLKFKATDITEAIKTTETENYDYIIMVDVLEHIKNMN